MAFVTKRKEVTIVSKNHQVQDVADDLVMQAFLVRDRQCLAEATDFEVLKARVRERLQALFPDEDPDTIEWELAPKITDDGRGWGIED